MKKPEGEQGVVLEKTARVFAQKRANNRLFGSFVFGKEALHGGEQTVRLPMRLQLEADGDWK